jgi:acyl-ACP thioesterase
MEHPAEDKYRERFEIYFHDADRTGHASLPAICRYLQTAAIKHGALVGTSIDHIASLNLTWVYSRFHVQMTSYPRCGELIFIDTWRSAVEESHAFREFVVRNSKSEPLGAATSTITLIDKSSRKPVDIPDAIRAMIAVGGGRAITSTQGKLPAMTAAAHTRTFPVRIGDIDINDHVNNISYMSWIMEGLPEDILLHLRPCEVIIAYRAEVFYGQSVVSESAPVPGKDHVFVHRLIRESDGRETNRALTVWR